VWLLSAIVMSSVHAQALLCLDSNHVPIDTFTVVLTIQGSSGGSGALPLGSQSIQIEWETIVEAIGGDFIIDPATIRLSGDSATIDALTTPQLFTTIAHTTISQAVALGYMPCTVLCTSPDTAVVRLPACVERMGTGETTHFIPCGAPGCCTRRYAVCCPNGLTEPVVLLLAAEGPPCEGKMEECESTCP
jgi:hypothetical protein